MQVRRIDLVLLMYSFDSEYLCRNSQVFVSHQRSLNFWILVALYYHPTPHTMEIFLSGEISFMHLLEDKVSAFLLRLKYGGMNLISAKETQEGGIPFPIPLSKALMTPLSNTSSTQSRVGKLS